MGSPMRDPTEDAVERVRLAPGFTLSRVSTGLWQIADMERGGNTLDPDLTSAALVPYFDAGLTTFAMADHYGSAEAIAGFAAYAETASTRRRVPGRRIRESTSNSDIISSVSRSRRSNESRVSAVRSRTASASRSANEISARARAAPAIFQTVRCDFTALRSCLGEGPSSADTRRADAAASRSCFAPTHVQSQTHSPPPALDNGCS